MAWINGIYPNWIFKAEKNSHDPVMCMLIDFSFDSNYPSPLEKASAKASDMRSWTIPSDDVQSAEGRAPTRRNPAKKLNSSNSDMESNNSDSSRPRQKRGPGGMAFEFLLNEADKSSPLKPSKPLLLTSANLARHRSATTRSSNNSGLDSSFNSQVSSQQQNLQSKNKATSSSSSSKGTTTSKTPRSEKCNCLLF